MPELDESQIRLNAWTGEASPIGDPNSGRRGWGLMDRAVAPADGLKPLRSIAPADLRDWRHPEVGWGLVLPDRDGGDPKTLAAGEDAPPALRRLLADRKDAPVLRYRADLHDGYLRRYYDDGLFADLSVVSSARG
ncbi:MAG: hypothetical protein JWO33_2765, partial [Caulobacteraceae bacterium]|nr:hypothetical protein [Caulobacteraceae bacterium]